VSCSFSYLPYSETNAFSHLVADYLKNDNTLKPFYGFYTDKEGIAQAILERKNFPTDRRQLVKVLETQYAGLPASEKVAGNIQSLLQPDTFTICTAHQPNLLTGYLYFVYKILHAIRLSEELKQLFPQNNFVPVYYMGSEDADLDELGTFRYNGKKFVWNGDGQKGAVGRMATRGLEELFTGLFKELGPPGEFCDDLKRIITSAYLQHDTIGKATQYLVHELFGRYGLIVIDPDDAALKQSFIPVMKDDLLHRKANDIVSEQMTGLSEHYKVQAHPRPINLFYLKDDIRERIEQTGDKWHVVNTDISWNEEALIKELEAHPERFSPNVILRGLFQETILPNVVFIGGGAEVAYWLQLRTLFAHYNVFYPSIHLRQSVLWIPAKERKLREQLHLSISDIFKTETELVHQFVLENSSNDWQTAGEMTTIEQTLAALKQKATTLDPTLRASAGAALARIRYQVQLLEKKMLRAEKRKMQDQLHKVVRLKTNLFPGNGLQERVENFITLYLQYGPGLFDVLKNAMQPLRHEFLVIEEQ